MDAKMIMVRYGELSTKGKNKRDFINLLASNIKRALRDFKGLVFEVKHDHIYIELNDEDYLQIKEKLKSVSGISSFSLVYRLENDVEVFKKEVLDLLIKENKKTFKIAARRTDKTFPYRSEEIIRLIASHVLKNTEYKVDVHHPDLLVSLIIRTDYTYLYLNGEEGAGGYPLGSAGKGLMMISGGIDSPVAAYLLMRRGISLEFIHYASPPYTNEGVIHKIKDLLNVLNVYQKRIKLYIIPFTKLQEEIYKNAPESYAITLMRRMMYRIAERVARKHNDLMIANGESIGQVASQTLKSIATIEAAASIPVIRPLAVSDKVQIISLAKQIGTYDISIRPFEDCCTIFDPKNPKTAPKLETVEELETKFDYMQYISEAIKTMEVVIIEDQKKEDTEDLL